MFIALLLVSHSEDDELGVVDTTISTGSEEIFTRNFWELNSETFRNLDGSSTVIAILDTGVRDSHSAFDSETIWKEKSRHFCTCKGSCLCQPYNIDYDGHGTCCAGIAAGRYFEKYPGGVANKAKLIICKVGEKRDSISAQAVIKALQYIIELQKTDEDKTNADKQKTDTKNCRVHVVSLSIGFKSLKPTTLCQMQGKINTLANQGTICVAAAGKKNTVLYPAQFENTIIVGSHDQCKQRCHSSPKSSKVCCLAPGESINAPTNEDDKALICKDGTSLAAPAVAGLVALIIQKLHGMDRRELVEFNFIRKCLEDMRNEEKVLNPTKFFIAFSNPDYVAYLCKQ